MKPKVKSLKLKPVPARRKSWPKIAAWKRTACAVTLLVSLTACSAPRTKPVPVLVRPNPPAALMTPAPTGSELLRSVQETMRGWVTQYRLPLTTIAPGKTESAR